jgi:regulator of protease activity HflC (stomatin/prohibitin superfamily)
VKRASLAALGALAALLLAGCESTSSTEVGVRTSLFGVVEKRGDQQVYAPGGVYLVLPIVNAWNTLSISQQNLLMNSSASEGDRPLPDDISFKTKDGNNVYIDVNVMWRVDAQKAGSVVANVGKSVEQIKERLVRPYSRSVIRDVFNEISSEEYYQVSIKNKMASRAKEQLAAELAPYGILVDMLQVHQHRFDREYQNAINAQKQAEADVQTLVEQQKAMEEAKRSELQGKRAEWNKLTEDALGEAGRVRNEADGYSQTQVNLAKATLARAQAESAATVKEAEALSKMGGEAFVKMEVAKQFAKKKILLVPAANVTTMNINKLVEALAAEALELPVKSEPARAATAKEQVPAAEAQ